MIRASPSDASAGSIEQPASELLFHTAHLVADRRLLYAECDSGRAERFLVGKGQQGTQLLRFE